MSFCHLATSRASTLGEIVGCCGPVGVGERCLLAGTFLANDIVRDVVAMSHEIGCPSGQVGHFLGCGRQARRLMPAPATHLVRPACHARVAELVAGHCCAITKIGLLGQAVRAPPDLVELAWMQPHHL